MHKHHDFPQRPPFPMEPPMDIMKELNHIYSLIENICTFKKIDFYEGDWSQNAKGYYVYEMPCQDYFVLAAYKEVDGAADEKLQHKLNTKGTMVTVTSTEPCDGYFAVAQVGNDCNFENPIYTVDRVLNADSLNAVSNSAVTTELNQLNAKLQQITMPSDVLLTSDIADWAKQPEKPCYVWEDICAKPNLVQKIIYGDGVIAPNKRGVVDFTDVLNQAVKEQVKLNAKNIKFSEIIDDSPFKEDIANLVTQITEHILRYNSKVSVLDQKDALLEGQVSKIEKDLIKLTNKQGSDLSSVLTAITNGDATTLMKCDAAVANLANTVEQNKADSEKEDTRLHADISALAYKCRIEHQMLDDLVQENALKIKKLADSIMAAGDYSQISDAIDRVNASIRDIQSQVEDKHSALQAQITENAKVSSSNKTAIADLRNDIVSNTDDIAANAEAIITLADKTIGDIETINTTIETTKNNLKNEISKDRKRIDAAEKAITDVQNSVADLEAKIPEIVDGLDITKVTASEVNGNIKVNGEELVVFRPDEIEVPKKLSQLENDTKFITRKEASGLVASAQVNFDTAFIDDDLENVTYVKTVNISNSQGSVVVNGDEIKVNIDGMTTIGALIEAYNERITALENELNTLRDTMNNAALNYNQAILANRTAINNLGNQVVRVSAETSSLQERVNTLEEKSMTQKEVTELPAEEEAKEGVIYLIKKEGTTDEENEYDEYIFNNGKFEKFGKVEIEMTAEDVRALFDSL